MRTYIQPFTYVEDHWIIEGNSGFARVQNEAPAAALVRAVNFMYGYGQVVVQVITLPNPARPDCPNFAFLYQAAS